MMKSLPPLKPEIRRRWYTSIIGLRLELGWFL
jgi:hypothetical protein